MSFPSKAVSSKYLEQSFRSDWGIDGIPSSDDCRIGLFRCRIIRFIRLIFLIFLQRVLSRVQVQQVEAGATDSTRFRFFELKIKLLTGTFVADNLI